MIQRNLPLAVAAQAHQDTLVVSEHHVAVHVAGSKNIARARDLRHARLGKDVPGKGWIPRLVVVCIHE